MKYHKTAITQPQYVDHTIEETLKKMEREFDKKLELDGVSLIRMTNDSPSLVVMVVLATEA